MQISTRGRYAVMAMVDLASNEVKRPDRAPVCSAEIAGRQQLSQSYVEPRFGKLRRVGLVCSARDPSGGHRLVRPADAISIAVIIAAADEPMRATRRATGAGGCPAAASAPRAAIRSAPVGATTTGPRCQTHDLWFELGRQIALFLEAITLVDVVQGRITGRAVGLPARIASPQVAGQRQEVD